MTFGDLGLGEMGLNPINLPLFTRSKLPTAVVN